jgi:phospholipid/cholesterol/gamma-HCH transport system substrate-binding protein
MDKRTRNIAALGLLTIVSVVILVWGAYWLMGSPILRGGVDYVVMLEDGAGLKRSDRVLVQGVQVGTVRTVDLTDDARVAVVIRLRDRVLLPADTRASVTGDVFGAHTVDLLPGRALVRLERGDTIRGAAAPQITQIAADLGTRAQSLFDAADSLFAIETVRDVRATMAVLPGTAAELQRVFHELRFAAAALRQGAEELAGAGTGRAVAGAVGRVEEGAQALTAAAASMERSLDAFASVLGKIDGGRGTLGRLVNDESLYLDIQQTLREMGLLAADIRERPGRYISLRIF